MNSLVGEYVTLTNTYERTESVGSWEGLVVAVSFHPESESEFEHFVLALKQGDDTIEFGYLRDGSKLEIKAPPEVSEVPEPPVDKIPGDEIRKMADAYMVWWEKEKEKAKDTTSHPLEDAVWALDDRSAEEDLGEKCMLSKQDWARYIKAELVEVVEAKSQEERRAEIGDLLCNVLRLANCLQIRDPLEAAMETVTKVHSRFDYIVKGLEDRVFFSSLKRREWVKQLWKDAKRKEAEEK